MTNKTERYYFYFWMFRVEYKKVLKYNLEKRILYRYRNYFA